MFLSYINVSLSLSVCLSLSQSLPLSTTMGHLHNGILLSCEKKKNLPFATVWMDLENTMLSETSQSEKDKYHMISLICGI